MTNRPTTHTSQLSDARQDADKGPGCGTALAIAGAALLGVQQYGAHLSQQRDVAVRDILTDANRLLSSGTYNVHPLALLPTTPAFYEEINAFSYKLWEYGYNEGRSAFASKNSDPMRSDMRAADNGSYRIDNAVCHLKYAGVSLGNTVSRAYNMSSENRYDADAVTSAVQKVMNDRRSLSIDPGNADATTLQVEELRHVLGGDLHLAISCAENSNYINADYSAPMRSEASRSLGIDPENQNATKLQVEEAREAMEQMHTALVGVQNHFTASHNRNAHIASTASMTDYTLGFALLAAAVVGAYKKHSKPAATIK